MKQIDDPHRFHDSHFENQALSFEQKGRMVIGGGFSAKGCKIHIAAEVECLMSGAEFVQCDITSQTEEHGRAQHAAAFRNCTFHGTFFSWMFGGRTGEPPVVACDFRSAELHDCEFYDRAISELKFRGWPTVVFVDPLANKERIGRASWPRGARAQIWVQTLSRAPVSGVAVDGNRAAKDLRVQPEELRRIIVELGDAVIS